MAAFVVAARVERPVLPMARAKAVVTTPSEIDAASNVLPIADG